MAVGLQADPWRLRETTHQRALVTVVGKAFAHRQSSRRRERCGLNSTRAPQPGVGLGRHSQALGRSRRTPNVRERREEGSPPTASFVSRANAAGRA